MQITIKPSKNRFEQIAIPASKSLLHRDLICASLAKGKSTIYNVTLNDDVKATINCLKNLGVSIVQKNDTLEIDASKPLEIVYHDFYPKESGSTLRFMIPIVGFLDSVATFYLEGKLGNRPLDDYERIFHENHCLFQKPNENNLIVKGPLINNEFYLSGNITSQYISGLLMASVLKKEEVRIHVKKPVESLPYIDLTLGEMEKFGVKITIKETEEEIIYLKKANSYYQSREVSVEGDYSQAAFFLSLGLINQPVVLLNIEKNSLQGDKQILEFLKQLGGNIENSNNELIFAPKKINGEERASICLDLKDTPDLAPILMAVGAISNQKIILKNTHRLIYKESNRAKAMQEELSKIGSTITVFDNEIIIEGIKIADIAPISKIIFDSHHDHRVVMSLAIIATVLQPIEQITITNADAINKSYPTFFDDLTKLGIDLQREE